MDDFDSIDKTVRDDLDVSGTQIGDGIRPQDLKPGSIYAGRYEILSEGFRGGMGVVYQCRDIKLQRQKALKIIHPDLLKSSNSLQRFRQEVAISQELQHEHIVRVYDLDEYQGQEFFTMEWVEGKNLRDLIVERKKEGRPFTLEEAYELLSQLNDALQYAHRYTVHRDIKPENILIKEDGEKQIIKLTDFGIAKMLTVSQFTTTSIQMGTPYYMAPEQKLDSGRVDRRADVYSVGVILFELLTLENTIGFDLPSEINRALPREIDEVIRQALATKPEKRYAEIKDFSQAFLRVVEQGKKKQEKEGQIRQAEEKKKQEIDELSGCINEELEKKNLSDAEGLIANLAKLDREKADGYGNRLAKLKDEIKDTAERERQRLAEEKKKQEERKLQREIEEQRKKYDTPAAPSPGPSSPSNVGKIIGVIAVACIVLFLIFRGLWQPTTQVAAPVPEPTPVPAPAPAPVPDAPASQPTANEPSMKFVFVKGGCFQMGDTFGDGEADEKPVHEVCVDDFYMGKYEVTQGQWREVMGNNPSYFKNCGDNCPVEQVSWNDVQEFISRLNRKSGTRYRLPTEAEWEYAARSGGRQEKYSGGNDVDTVAWYDGNSGNRTHPVGQKRPNGLGLYDMSGNVWEWCEDWYGTNYYAQSSRNNPKGPSSGSHRVLRGGSWYDNARDTRAADCLVVTPAGRSNFLGFRLLRTK